MLFYRLIPCKFMFEGSIDPGNYHVALFRLRLHMNTVDRESAPYEPGGFFVPLSEFLLSVERQVRP